MTSIIAYVSTFFAKQLRREVKELYFSVAILDFAVAAVSLFEPIYLWKIGFGIPEILLFYLSVYTLYFFILPLGAKIAQGKGFEHSILYSSPFLILYYLSLFAIPFSPWFIGVAVISFAIQKALYWPGYHGDFAVYSEDGERGKELSNLAIMMSLAAAVGPIAGGLLIYFFGFPTLFMIASAAILASNIPLFSTREEFTPKTFSYTSAYANLIKKENRRPVFSYFGYGEELIFMVLWPVFLFVILKNELSVGSLAAIATIMMMIVVLYIGKLTDQKNKRSVLKTGVFLSGASWLMRVFMVTPLGIFFADTITRIGRNITQVPLLTLTYDTAKRESFLRPWMGVMERVVLFEMTLILGKMTAMILLLVLFFVLPEGWFWNAAFLLAGAMTLLYGLL